MVYIFYLTSFCHLKICWLKYECFSEGKSPKKAWSWKGSVPSFFQLLFTTHWVISILIPFQDVSDLFICIKVSISFKSGGEILTTYPSTIVYWSFRYNWRKWFTVDNLDGTAKTALSRQRYQQVLDPAQEIHLHAMQYRQEGE